SVHAVPKAVATTAHRYLVPAPFQAEVLENLVITGRGSSKETRHFELSLDGSGLTYEPGDALGITAPNDPALVREVLDCLKLDGDQPVALGETQPTLRAALGTAFEIATATPRFLTHWAELSGAAELSELAGPDRAAERAAFLTSHHVIDIVRRFPVSGLEPRALIAGLRAMQPRLYSIASSQDAQGGDAHLTVSTVRYGLNGSDRWGVASGHLARHIEAGATVPVHIKANPHFRLPADDVPILMVGAGTGVAPYRGFAQQRELRGARGRSWLFFGDRNFRSDFLYQVEWQQHLKAGSLTFMDVAFSRDGTAKTYVQHRMLERGVELYAWLEDGAHLYVCGDAKAMAPDVHKALLTIVETVGGHTPEAAEEYVRTLQRDGRYQRDVY
ncbi:MAG: sulfite reductase [NADPH] flavoprotein alpha-component, partial [Hyphomicrobiales bacterium]